MRPLTRLIEHSVGSHAGLCQDIFHCEFNIRQGGIAGSLSLRRAQRVKQTQRTHTNPEAASTTNRCLQINI